jgi:hypothetical protein
VAFVFDPKRQAVLLVAGDKTGANQKLFYQRLMDKAEKRYDVYLAQLKLALVSKEKSHGKKSR